MPPTYTVVLPLFEGPLDLLLHLIEERELDITKVSLAAVTDQYIDHLSRLEKLEPEQLAAFLTIAAKLLLIKSRMLLPQPVPEEPEEEDVGDDLVRQLLEYRKYKAVAQKLRDREEEGLRAYARLLPLPEIDERSLRLEGVTLDSLLEALQEALSAQAASSADEMVTPLTISLPEKIAELDRLVLEQGQFSLNRLLAQAASRMEIIVTFLALLQLIKRGKAAVEQEELFGEITVRAAD